MAYNSLGTRYTFYVSSGTSTPEMWDIRGYGKAYYDQTTTDLTNNQSRIKLEYGVTINGTWTGQYKVTGTIYQKINNVWTSISTTTYQSSMATFTTGTYLRGTLTDVIIPHDSDGNGQVRVGVTITGQALVTGTKSYVYTYDLPTIQEQALIENVEVQEGNATLTGYGITANQYVNLLSNKLYTISVYNPNSIPISTYEVINGTLTNRRHYAINSNNSFYLNFNDIQIYTENINGQDRPSMIAKVNFNNGGSIYSYINYNINTFVPYEYPQFYRTSTTTKRNGQLSGKVTLNASGTYYNGMVGTLNQSGTYKPTIKYKIWKTGTTEPSTYAYTISSSNITISDGTFNVTNYEIGNTDTSASNYFDYNYSYNVKLQVSDTFKSDEYTAIVTQGIAIWTEYSNRVDFRKITITDTSSHTITTQLDNNGISTNKIIASNIQGGTETITNSATGTQVNFTNSYTNPPNVVLTPITTASGNITIKIIEITTTGFKAFNSTSSSVDACWIAIGD